LGTRAACRRGREEISIRMTGGRYSVDFEGSNLSSGIYFYKLSSEEFVATKRMVLIK
jgi:hypothetical protein